MDLERVRTRLATVADTSVVEVGSSADLDRLFRGLNGRIPVFAGGDGTVHHGLQAVRRFDHTGPVGIIPMGTGNDFARNCGLPLDIDEAAQLVTTGEGRAVAALQSSLGVWVANNAHLGLGREAAEAAVPLKRRLRALAYPMATLMEGMRYEGHRLTALLDDREVFDGVALAVAVLLGPSVGGGIDLIDGVPKRADLVVVERPRTLVGRLRYLRIGLDAPSRQTLAKKSGNAIPGLLRLGGSRVDLRSDRPMQGDIDGELDDWGEQVTFHYMPEAWTIIGAGGAGRAS